MTPENLIDAINEIRDGIARAVALLRESASFRSLLDGSVPLKTALDDLATVLALPRLARPCDGRVTCAIVGSSGHGKTTILDEMFPDLAKRGWLVTDVTDTTAQSLRIEHAAPRSKELSEVLVNSWTLSQLKELTSHPEVVEQNGRDQIGVVYHEDRIEVDGSEAAFPASDLEQFRFPRNVTLRPFSQPFRVTEAQAADPKFIRALTIKEQSAALEPTSVLNVDGESYDSLQLRALVKDVRLRDPFQQLKRWCGAAAAVEKLVFVDTPGLAVSGSIKDEVLKHVLEKKSHQVVLQLLKDDELDIVVHLVLCGRQTDFATLWKSIERECGPGLMESLAERLILAINGVNVYFTNRDLRRRYLDPAVAAREGDHIATTVEDNILQKMSPHGRLQPARICFLDSKGIVETLTGSSYERAYEGYCLEMAKWASPGGVGYDTLLGLGLDRSFEENAQALADPSDRGQGYLVRQILELVAEKGPIFLIKKYLVRTRLRLASERMRETLLKYYDAEGRVSREGIEEALRSCLQFLDGGDLTTIESFARAELDPRLEAVLHGASGGGAENWVGAAFRRFCGELRQCIVQHAKPARGVAAAFERYFDDLTETWAARWGYDRARLSPPEQGPANTSELLRHCLAVHGREILYQLVAVEGAQGAHPELRQSREDRERVRSAIDELTTACRSALGVCADYGVEP
ncbi:MAG: hypothetical protein AB1486_04195 [Planctomycetota bacterium]